MSTTECGEELHLAKTPAIAPAGLRLTTGNSVLVRLAYAWRAIRNRIAASPLSDFDDRMLDDIGLSRRDVVAALDHSGALDDPSLLLARAARERARTRFAKPPVR
ncbi:DUF1127 domain-containing protein [Neorhizobium sp. NCHU2750]|uniref:DUF1127 domain-containing protein n=1 Tax=Neorhizobium sp. NCHU2750 TaxID=1825976 RepID=UPI000E7344D0|nr:hypothetical protein NCHU2750_03540 [Neorhizobium sp. NCHU2750]